MNMTMAAHLRRLQPAVSRVVGCRRRLHGLMQDTQPLLIQSIIEHANRVHSDVELTSRWCSEDAVTSRSTYGDARDRAGRLAERLLEELGCARGDRVATLCFNHRAHFDAYFGVPGAGLVLHTVNPRLYEHQLAYVSGVCSSSYRSFARPRLDACDPS